MNETMHPTDGATNNNESRRHENTVMGNAFKELAQKLTGKKEEIATNNVSEVLKNGGIIGESRTANVVSFPFERTEEAQQELGREVGAVAKEIIERHEQNQNEISPIGDTISHMTSEKPPVSKELITPTENLVEQNSSSVVSTFENLNEATYKLKQLREAAAGEDQWEAYDKFDGEIKNLEKELADLYSGKQSQPVVAKKAEATPTETEISYKQSPEDSLMKAADPVVYKTLEGKIIPIKPLVEQEPAAVAQEILVPQKSPVRGWSPAHDEIIARIQQEVKEEYKKIDRAGKQLRDHTKDAAEPQNTINMADARLSELDLERENYIKEKIRDMPPGEVTALKTAAHEEFSDDTVTDRTVATAISKLTSERIEQDKKTTETVTLDAREHPETTSDAVEETKTGTIESAPQKDETIVSQDQEGIEISKEKALNPFEKAIAGIKSEDPARAERLLAAISASPEQKERIEKLLGATQIQKEKIETEAKEKDSWVVERARKTGEWYRRLPLKYKLAAAAVLGSTASATAILGGAGVGMIVGAALVGSTGQRFLGSLAMFATVEGILTKRLEERNLNLPPERRDSAGRLIHSNNYEEEGRLLGVRMNVIWGALAGSGVFLGGKLLGEFLSTHIGGGAGSGAGEKIVSQIKVPSAAPENIPGVGTKELYAVAQEQIHKAMPLPHEEMAGVNNPIMTPGNELFGHATAIESASSIMTPENEIIGHAADKMIETSYAVHGGDNLWNIIKEKIPEIQNLDGEGRQSNAIANIIEQIKKDPESFGISSGNVDNLSAGDTLNLEKVHHILNTAKIPIENGEAVGIIERASGLTDIESSHIIENNAKIAEWHTAHPDTPLTTEVADKILSNSTDIETGGNETHSNSFENIRKDMETTEAISMKAEAALRDDIQTMFGSKGFFGYGFLGTNGEKSVDWLDLKGRSVSEIMSKKFVEMPSMGEGGAVQKFGIDSPSVVDKLKEYIKLLIDKSGVSPDEGESVERFAKRSIKIAFSKK